LRLWLRASILSSSPRVVFWEAAGLQPASSGTPSCFACWPKKGPVAGYNNPRRPEWSGDGRSRGFRQQCRKTPGALLAADWHVQPTRLGPGVVFWGNSVCLAPLGSGVDSVAKAPSNLCSGEANLLTQGGGAPGDVLAPSAQVPLVFVWTSGAWGGAFRAGGWWKMANGETLRTRGRDDRLATGMLSRISTQRTQSLPCYEAAENALSPVGSGSFHRIHAWREPRNIGIPSRLCCVLVTAGFGLHGRGWLGRTAWGS